MTPLNVQNNYWGSNFTPSTDLYPSGVYTYLPIWTLLPGKKDVDVAEQEYNTANQKIEQGDYAGAKSILKQMPVDYSSSIYAQAAMGFVMECYENGILNEERTGGLKLNFGNADAAMELLHQAGRGEGFGLIAGMFHSQTQIIIRINIVGTDNQSG